MKEFIDLIKAYLNNEQLNTLDNDEALVKLAKEQSLQTLLYPVYNDKKYKSYYISGVIKQEKFYVLQDEITKLFNNKNIKHIYFKGSILSKIYDDPSVRTRGDIDLYVDLHDYEKAKKVLEENNYKIDDENRECMHHICFKKYDVEIELHFNMFEADVNKCWRQLFKNPFDLCDNMDDSLYYFTTTYHFVYCLMHFAHHLYYGAGIRYILDFYYMLKKTSIDFELLHNILIKCKLSKLYSNVIIEIRKLFDVDFDNFVKSKDVSFFENYMLSHGIHGHERTDKRNQTIHKHKLSYAITFVFLLDKNYKKTHYQKLCKWYFYPLCLIVHWLYLITHKFKGFIKLVFGKNKELYKKIGI